MSKVSESDVINTLKKALGPDATSLTIKTKASDILTWDSLGHLGVLAALDKQFNGKIAPISELASANSVKQILDLLKQHALI